MESNLVGKVENDIILKKRKRNKVQAIIGAILAVLTFLFEPWKGIEGLFTFWAPILLMISTVVMYLNNERKIKNDFGIPFVEWWTDKVVYRSKKESERSVILNKDILSIKIKADEIDISAINNRNYLINLDEYLEYTDRVTIKTYFENLSHELAGTRSNSISMPAS